VSTSPTPVAVIGAGPAGLIAAETLAAAGVAVTVYDRMLSPARKFLMAGRGGLNLTHSEDFTVFMQRYGAANPALTSAIIRFSPENLRAWCEGLGQETFIGSSGRVFPKAFKASPLLRAWLQRLDQSGVRFAFRQEWRGWDASGRLLFNGPDGMTQVETDAVILALGGASWPRLGADGGWVPLLQQQNIPVSPLRPANCGFHIEWSPVFSERLAGQPLKSTGFSFGEKNFTGEAMITRAGIEGSAIYALSSVLRQSIETQGSAILHLDLRPGLSMEALQTQLRAPRGAKSLSTYLRGAGFPPVAIGLLQEISRAENHPLATPEQLARLIKNLPLCLTAPFPLDRAISSAGGIRLDALDEHFMLRQKPGVFAAGEMLDWEAPTGGYLLQACFSTGIAAAQGALQWRQTNKEHDHP
jgi:uncharacterized flavoprotein (TIGR03862 family)